MQFFKKKEKRAEDSNVHTDNIDSVLLRALIDQSTITKREALEIPTVQFCINFIANTISVLPICLYKKENNKIVEIKEDVRIRLLNNDPKDTLNATQFWRAMIQDYFLNGSAYAYINKEYGKIKSLHYVEWEAVSITKNAHPIFKDYDILIDGNIYNPFSFLKILRNTKDGSSGRGILQDSSLMLTLAYNMQKYENVLVKKGGNKRGFLTSKSVLSKETIDMIRESWRNLYENNTENIIVLNKDMDFKEASNTSVEMQLNENKITNAAEICKLFLVPESILKGTITNEMYFNAIKTAVIPILIEIECALNRDLLLEKEKGIFYFSFNTKELLRGNIKERFEAYGLGIDKGFLKIDDVREMEDLEAIGFEYIKLGLESVLYNPKTGEIYTPNTNETKGVTDEKKKEKKEVEKENED